LTGLPTPPASAVSLWSAREPERSGRVAAFDDDRGLGTVADEAGNVYWFHCTALSDGSRSVAVGTPVLFRVAAGHLGRLEGRDLRRVS
jgi:cold shock CspA family protein